MTIIRKRWIRPSTRDPKSTTYKIDVKKVFDADILVVEIRHESDPSFLFTYTFDGKDLKGKYSIHFDWVDDSVIWKDATPCSFVSSKAINLYGAK